MEGVRGYREKEGDFNAPLLDTPRLLSPHQKLRNVFQFPITPLKLQFT